jgi:hypothetical protein
MTSSLRTIALITIVALVAACGPSARESTIKTTLTGVNVARAAFIAWDDEMQDRIVEQATSLEEGKAKLELHRKKRAELLGAFEASYYAMALAATNPNDLSVADVLATAAVLYRTYKSIVGVDPPKPKGK